MIRQRVSPVVMRAVCALIFLMSPSATTTTRAQVNHAIPQERSTAIESIVRAYASGKDFNGAILVGVGDHIVYQGAFGYANRSHDVLNTIDTRFRLASVSKQFTAAALLLLESENRVDLEAPIERYLPDLTTDFKKSVTIHHLLSHTSGLPRDIEELTDDAVASRFTSPDELLSFVNSATLRFEPGELWAYSNVGYLLSALIIESVTGMSYGDALNDLLFVPADMTNTGHESGSVIVPHLANGYVGLPEATINAAYENKSYVLGAGTIYSTVGDMFMWIRQLRNPVPVLNPNIDKMLENHSKRYGYGWWIDTYIWPPKTDSEVGRSIHHDGGSPGFASKVSIYAEHDLVIVMLSNKLPSSGYALLNHLGNHMLGFDESIPKANDYDAFYRALSDDDPENVVALVESFRNEKNYHMYPGYSDLLLVGRGYLDSNQYEEAIDVFTVLTVLRPQWTLPYLFKGIAQVKSGDAKSARDAFDAVLEINPQQSNALSWLKKLDER